MAKRTTTMRIAYMVLSHMSEGGVELYSRS
jgi:hypothetical protein